MFGEKDIKMLVNPVCHLLGLHHSQEVYTRLSYTFLNKSSSSKRVKSQELKKESQF